ncbi:hypothetical protein EDC56_1211 [Sinobacterium caligoides]|uniref:Uncharacterized protein n=1 Tax=Sinobacterium caligoides TaxID=933926 RepID=A0A3N2E265_9GAMM|nr:hypothetical protein [Sinobacterium caligoides]ROS05665.1 hypothetical protein EDC56_1211 [Sinobacterium caligoides]
MIEFKSYIATLIDRSAEEFPELSACHYLPGFVETTTIDEIHNKTPALYFSQESVDEIKKVSSGQKDVTVGMVAYLLHSGEAEPIAREAAMVELHAKLISFLAGNRWGLDNVFPPKKITSVDVYGLMRGFATYAISPTVRARCADLYGAGEDSAHLSLMVVSWQQTLRTGVDAFEGSGPSPFKELYSHPLHEDKPEQTVEQHRDEFDWLNKP